jgi:hypothetical protein
MQPGYCGNSNNGGVSSARDITAFTILGIDGTIGPNVVSLTVPYGTSLTSLTPTIIITGASVSPASGAAQNFSSPVTYTVTAADASTKEYVVTVTVASASKYLVTSSTYSARAGAAVTISAQLADAGGNPVST